jgi:hypothetical protein
MGGRDVLVIVALAILLVLVYIYYIGVETSFIIFLNCFITSLLPYDRSLRSDHYSSPWVVLLCW